MSHCPSCNYPLSSVANFCPSCGVRCQPLFSESVEGDSHAKASQVAASQDEFEPPANVLAYRCPVCHSRRATIHNFCSVDGYPFDGSEIDKSREQEQAPTPPAVASNLVLHPQALPSPKGVRSAFATLAFVLTTLLVAPFALRYWGSGQSGAPKPTSMPAQEVATIMAPTQLGPEKPQYHVAPAPMRTDEPKAATPLANNASPAQPTQLPGMAARPYSLESWPYEPSLIPKRMSTNGAQGSRTESEITLRGTVPSEQEKQKMLNSAQSKHEGRKVRDMLFIVTEPK